MYKLYKTDLSLLYPNAAMTIGVQPQVSFLFDPDNTDAKQFAKWLSEGGVPESAIEGETVSAEWIAETIAKLLPAKEQALVQ
jgi:hypothetical protein